MDEKEAEARPLMGTIFLVFSGQANKFLHFLSMFLVNALLT